MKVTIDGVEYSPTIYDDTPQRPLSDVLQHARDVSGQTLDQVSAAIGTSKGYLWTIENGKSEPGFSLAMRLLRHYQISADRVEV